MLGTESHRSDRPASAYETAKPQVVSALSAGTRWAPWIHGLALAIAATMAVGCAWRLWPAVVNLGPQGKWHAVVYAIVVSLSIAIYWPGAAYRLLLLCGAPFSQRSRTQRYPLLGDAFLSPIVIVIAVRNEPMSVLRPLLDAIANLDYPDYEVIVADNSDLIHESGAVNRDAVALYEFVRASRWRLVRRAKAHDSDERHHTMRLGDRDFPVKGEIRGGKAANINAAIASCDERIQWSLILDADSAVTSHAVRQLVSVALGAKREAGRVGFVQGLLSSTNAGESFISEAQSVLDDLYYSNYLRLKCATGLISNFGHGVLISHEAWRVTNGLPLEISEDLAWANELLLRGGFANFYAIAATGDGKPATWSAFKAQRHRWAKGTTVLLWKQLSRVWTSKYVRWYEKLDLTYDMSSYLLAAIGCLLPLLFAASNLLGPARERLFATLLPAFLLVLTMDNLMVPLEACRLWLRGDRAAATRIARAIPLISIFHGGIAAETFKAVTESLWQRQALFVVTPKGTLPAQGFRARLGENKFSVSLAVLNGWIAAQTWAVNPWVASLLAISPVCYLLAPFLADCRGRGENRIG